MGLSIVRAAVLAAAVVVAGRDAVGQRSLSPPVEVVADTSYGKVDLDLDVLTLDGSRASLAEYQGRVLFINFWATWCPPCVAELPSIERLRRRLDGSGVEVLLIATDDDVDQVRSFLKKHGIRGQVVLRRWKAGESPFRRAVVPTTYVVSRSGEIRYRHSGAVDWDSEAFAAYLRGLTAE